jgi:predicted dehydrogenase
MDNMIRVGICGFGYWGPNLYRNFGASPNFEVTAVSDPLADCREKARRLNGQLALFADARELIDSGKCDAVAIATPVAMHYQQAAYALRKKKHVLVEKPLCANSEEAGELVALAQRERLTLLVDHVFLFHNAVRELKRLAASGAIGTISYYDSLRVNLGLFQPDVNVLWDLAPHDFAIMNYLFDEEPVHFEATGYCHVNQDLPDIVYVTAHYRSHMIAHLNLSWMSPVKVRRIAVGGSKQMVVWDDLNPEERIKIYNSGVDFRPQSERLAIVPSYRIGDIVSPRIVQREALGAVVEEFAKAITERSSSIIDGREGARVVRMLEQAQAALQATLRKVAKQRFRESREKDRIPDWTIPGDVMTQ